MYYDWELEYAMRILYVGAMFYEHHCLDRLLNSVSENVCVQVDDIVEIEQAATMSVFEDSRYYPYDQRRHRQYDDPCFDDVIVLRDPLLTRYDALCREFERRKGITKVENDYARDLESAVLEALRIQSYCYDYRWYDGTQDRKGPKLVLIFSEEFDVYCEVPRALFDILDFCKEGIPEIEASLRELEAPKVIQMPVPARKKGKKAA